MTDAVQRPALPDDAFAGASSDGDLHATVSYFGQPLLKRPHWDWNVVTYLFLGGVMGGSGLLAALADASHGDGDRQLARTSRYLSIVLAAACPAVLISHLGRPERFTHMLRVVKFKSPMSMGVWGLVGYSAFAGLNAASQLARDGVLPHWIARLEPRGVTIAMQALFGAFTAGYTGVLLSATAIPLWSKGKAHIPMMSVCSAVGGACAANALLLATMRGSASAIHKLERLEAVAAIAELAVILHFETHAGEYGTPMFTGARGERFRTYTLVAGLAVPLVLNAPSLLAKPRHDRKPNLLKTLVAGVLTLVGGYILRETLIEAGKSSADDPRAAFRQPE